MMTLTEAKLEIARVAGAGPDPNKLALAGSAVIATAKRWSNKNNWEWTRRDNSLPTTIAACSLADTAVTNINTSGLNIGQTVSGSGIAAGKVITAIPSISSLTITSTGITNTSIDLTFSGYIPVIAGTSSYFLPSDFNDFYSARLLSSKRTLEIVRDRQADRSVPDQSVSGPAVAITFAPVGSDSGFTAADQRPRCHLLPYLPDTSENLFLRYYRRINGAASPIDIPEDFEQVFLEDCKLWFLAHLNSNDPRLGVIGALAKRDLEEAVSKDRDIADEDVRMKSQMEIFMTNYTERGRALRGF